MIILTVITDLEYTDIFLPEPSMKSRVFKKTFAVIFYPVAKLGRFTEVATFFFKNSKFEMPCDYHVCMI